MVFLNYVDKANHYQLAVPSKWTPMEASFAAEHHLLSGFRDLGKGKFHPTVTMQVFGCPSLQEFDSKSRQDVQSQGKLVSQRDIKLGAIPARQLVWTCDRQGQHLETLSEYFVVDGKSYVLNAVTVQSDWPKLGPVFAYAARSLRYNP
jgi:hypothetical protein